LWSLVGNKKVVVDLGWESVDNLNSCHKMFIDQIIVTGIQGDWKRDDLKTIQERQNGVRSTIGPSFGF
jgi:hypothetical protein